MKNDNSNHIRQARSNKSHKALLIDVVVAPGVVENNTKRTEQNPPRRKRRIDYAKKIMNDDFIMNA